ncbi:hypothetical protein OVA14_04030 [Agrococcus sp. SL85]|nr:hypothetical protein [Agrococcus sp. SL85]WAC66942.1 hypothetical protein OVA14_04030 [Agrococcus sp. SL85]
MLDRHRAERAQPRLELLDAARERRHVGARAREQLHGDRADAAARARDEDVGAVEAHPGVLQREHAERGRVARRAHRGRVHVREPGGDAREHVRLDARPLGEAAVARLAQAPAVHEHALARRPPRGVLRDRAHEVDAGHLRPVADDAGAAADREAVLEVDRRMRDLDEHGPVELGLVEVDDARRRGVAGGQQRAHRASSPPSASTARSS